MNRVFFLMQFIINIVTIERKTVFFIENIHDNDC